MKTTLIIMAAGIGSRYGGGIKQLAKVGPSGELIIDYSVHDAIEAGFDDVIFVIRRDIEKEFREVIGDRLGKLYNCSYAFQEVNELPENFKNPEGRTKPWGTGHAVLACKNLVKNPCLVINSDDYYGKEVFVEMHNFLVNELSDSENKLSLAMPGFVLKNTLSDNGTVTRGVCNTDAHGYLSEIVETKSIERKADGLVHAVSKDGCDIIINENSSVSMNMWAFSEKFMQSLYDGFVEFLSNEENGNSMKAEYLLPIFIGELLEKGEASVKVIPTNSKWFGVTYHEDKEYVVNEFKKLVEAGVYPKSLF